LSKQVQDIGWNKASASDDTIIRINPNGGSTIALQMNKEGKIVESHPRSQASQFEGKHLSDIVGKEVAEKIKNKIENPVPYKPVTELPKEFSLIRDRNGAAKGQEWGIISKEQTHARSATGRYHATEQEAVDEMLKQINSNEKLRHDEKQNSLSNLDLKIGGEGMKGFYDNIIPKSVEKIAKEFGVKVQKGEVGKSNNTNYRIENDTGKINSATDKYPHAIYYDTPKGEKKFLSAYATEKEAKEALVKLEKDKQPIFYIDIPPAMRQAVMQKGQPLFSGTPTLTPVNYNPFEEETK